jgi:glycosyltransferase involved in cell wall biosynthesis
MPLLSICIPTYNRAELLRSTLAAVVPQIKGLEDEVELVVSDNCSVDHTKAVVDSFMESCPISYYRNKENIGFGRNIALLTGTLARGEYCWIIGDDDTIREGGVRKVVEILKMHPELDYVYVNYCPQIPFPNSDKDSTSDTDLDLSGLGNKDRREKRVDRWEQLLEEDVSFLTPIFCSVFRLSLWREAMRGLRIGVTPTNAVNLYPQTIILAKAMLGKPSWSTGYPWVANGLTISWTHLRPLIALVCQDLFDTLEDVGIDPKSLRTHRRHYLRISAQFLADVVNNPETQKPDGFSFRNFVFKYFEYGELTGFLLFLACIDIRRGFRKYPMISAIALGATPLVLIICGVLVVRNQYNMRERLRARKKPSF